MNRGNTASRSLSCGDASETESAGPRSDHRSCLSQTSRVGRESARRTRVSARVRGAGGQVSPHRLTLCPVSPLHYTHLRCPCGRVCAVWSEGWEASARALSSISPSLVQRQPFTSRMLSRWAAPAFGYSQRLDRTCLHTCSHLIMASLRSYEDAAALTRGASDGGSGSRTILGGSGSFQLPCRRSACERATPPAGGAPNTPRSRTTSSPSSSGRARAVVAVID
jgi:hypothetical protein